MRKYISLLAALVLAAVIAAPAAALADWADRPEDGVYTVCDEQGAVVLRKSGAVHIGDEYISGDNVRYRITGADAATLTATAQRLGDEEMPDVSGILASAGAGSAARRIALYCTHSDESYIKGDGKSSDENYGGIYDVSTAFAEELKALGIEVIIDYSTHFPHDSGAYSRSRATAVNLLEQNPAAIFDIHRDGVAEDEYTGQVDGENVTKVRLLVGQSNQNFQANSDFAKTVKAVADELYPGLVKDIYIGKGNYNQEFAPHSLLLEFGTHESSKDEVLSSTGYMAEVISLAVFGDTGSGEGGAAGGVSPDGRGAEETPGGAQGNGEGNGGAEGAGEGGASSGGVWKGFIWLAVIAVGGGLLLVLFSRGGRQFGRNVGRGVSEMTLGLFGKKPDKEKK